MGFWERNWKPRMRFSSSASSVSSRSGWLASIMALHLTSRSYSRPTNRCASSRSMQRLVGLDHGLALDEQVVFAVEFGVLDFLAVLFEALQALFEHREIVDRKSVV